MRIERVLLLGGTQEGRELASVLAGLDGFEVVTSLAGVTSIPSLPDGPKRRGGFGGADGLATYLRDNAIDTVIDATHPFAMAISVHAEAACSQVNCRSIRLERPAWQPRPADRWVSVRANDAAAAAPLPGSVVLLTIGSRGLDPFLARTDLAIVARMIEPNPATNNTSWTILLARPPFSVEAECQLIDKYNIGWMVTKNAGGRQTDAKLEAARQRHIPVVMIERPENRPQADCETVGEALQLLQAGHN